MAAIYAAALYGLEIVKRLGQNACVDVTHLESCDVRILCDKELQIFPELPPDFNASSYTYKNHEFVNLGRLALIGVEVAGQIKVQSQDGKSAKNAVVTAKLGNIRVDGLVHVTVYFAPELRSVELIWKSAKESTGSKLEFHETSSEPVRVSFQFDEIGSPRIEREALITVTPEEIEAASAAAAKAAVEALLKKKSSQD
jgi:hypothetical protein